MIGGITSTGTFSTTDDTVCSSNYMLCDGLRIERKTDTKTQMRVYYYDINKQYLGCSDKVRGNYIRNADFPLAGFCRIVLYPDMGEKNSDEFFVTIFDVDDIVKEFNITVNKKQDFTAVCRATLKNELEEWVDREINVYDEFFYDSDETTSLTASYAGFSNSSWYSIQTPLENNQVFSFSLELGRYFSSDDLSSNNFSIMDPIIRLSNGSTYNYYDPHVGFRLRQGTFFSKFMDNIPLDIYRKEALGPNLINGENKVIYYFAFSRYKDYIYMSIKMSEGPYSNNYTTLCRYSVSNEPYNMVLSMMASGSNYAMTYILKDIRIDDVENLPDYIPEIN